MHLCKFKSTIINYIQRERKGLTVIMFSQVKESKESNQRLKEKVHQQDQDLYLLKVENSKKDKELDSLKSEKLKMMLNKQRSEKMNEQRYEKMKKEITSKLKEANEEIEEMTSRHKEVTAKDFRRIQLMTTMMSKLSTTNEALVTKLSSSKEEVKLLEDMKKYLDGKLNAANALVSSTEDKLSSSMKEAKLLEDMKKDLDGKLNAANALVSSTEDKLSSSMKEAKLLEDTKKDLDGKLNAANALVSSTEDKLSSSMEEAKVLEDSKEKLEGKLKAANALLSSTEDKLSSSMEEAKVLEDSKEKLEGKLKAANGCLEDLTKEVEGVTVSLQEQTTRMNAANGSLEDLTKGVEGVSVSLREKTEKLEELDGKLKAANESLEEKTNEFKKELCSTEHKLSLLNTRSVELEASKRDVEEMNEALERELNEAKSSLEETRTNLSSKNDSLGGELKAVSTRHDNLVALSNKHLEDQNSKLTESRMKLLTAAAEKSKYEKKLSEVQEGNQKLIDGINDIETKLKATENKLEQERTSNKEAEVSSKNKVKELQDLTQAQKNWSTTLNYAIKSGTEYPTGTHTSMEKFITIVLKRFKDSNTADDPSSFFPIEREHTDDLLQVLIREQGLVNLIQSDPVLVRTFHELVQKSFAAEVENVNFFDTLVSFNSWVSTMIFKNLDNLLTAITKKRRVDNAKSNSHKKQKPNSTSAVSSTTTSTVSASVGLDKTEKVSARKWVSIRYNDIDAKEGAIVKVLIGKKGVSGTSLPRLVLLDKQKDDDHWYAYALKRNKNGHLHCPFCQVIFNPQGFTQHIRSCMSKRKDKKARNRRCT